MHAQHFIHFDFISCRCLGTLWESCDAECHGGEDHPTPPVAVEWDSHQAAQVPRQSKAMPQRQRAHHCQQTPREDQRRSPRRRCPSCLERRLVRRLSSQSTEQTDVKPPFPYPNAPPAFPARPHCPAKDQLLKWRPLSTVAAVTLNEGLEKRYQLTAHAQEPSTPTSYASGLLVFHVWSHSKGLPKMEHAPFSQETITTPRRSHLRMAHNHLLHAACLGELTVPTKCVTDWL